MLPKGLSNHTKFATYFFNMGLTLPPFLNNVKKKCGSGRGGHPLWQEYSEQGNRTQKLSKILSLLPTRYARTEYSRLDSGEGCSISVNDSTQVFYHNYHQYCFFKFLSLMMTMTYFQTMQQLLQAGADVNAGDAYRWISNPESS